MLRLEYPYDNWTEESEGVWRRDVEGRKSLWYAVVWQDGDTYRSKVKKKGVPSAREARMRLSAAFSLSGRDLPSLDKEWTLRPCESRDKALGNVERYISTRCNPGTWRGPLSAEAKTTLDLAVNDRLEAINSG